MPTKVVKDDIIRVRITKENKKKLKKIAQEKNTTISEIISVATEKEIKIYDENQKNYEKISERAVATEEKIQKIKVELEKRKLKNKKSFFKNILKK